ncbi:MFS transporter [Photobacterium sanguinicancri]|uniref:MFS transporter n=1 Tax=Photobacterium sanguinicancri TaxID=875932 RepID=UPI003D09C5EA
MTNTKNKYIFSAAWLFPLVAAAPLGLDICLPSMTIISDDLGSSLSLTQWVISGYVLCLSIGQLVFGPLVDRYGAQKIFVLGAMLFCFNAALVYFVTTMPVLLFLRILQGVGASAVAVSIFSSVPKLFSGNVIGKVFGILNGVISLVPLLAPIIGGIIVSNYSWQGTFYFLAIYLILCLLLIIKKPLPRVKTPTKRCFYDVMSGYRQVWLKPEFKLGCLASACGFASQLIFFSSSPIVIVDVLNISVSEFGYYFSVNALAITCGSVVAAKCMGKYKEITLLHYGGLMIFIAGLGLLMTSLTELSVWGYILPASFGSFGFALLMAAGASIALSSFKELSGTASALMACIQMTFASIVSWIVIANWSADWVSMIMGYFVLSITIMILLLMYRANNVRLN